MKEIIRSRMDICGFDPVKRPRIAVFSYWNSHYEPLAKIAIPNWRKYCERHGYLLRFYPGEYHEDPARPETFGDKGKFRLYYDLRGHVDLVMFLDIDALFMNMDQTIEEAVSLVAPHPGYIPSFVWTYDDSGPLSGLWIATTNSKTERHLRYAYTRASIESHVRHGKIEPNGISDQDSMRDLMNIPPFRETFQHCYSAEVVGHCYESNYKTGKWLITFPGMSLEDKRKKMETYAALAV